MRVLGVRVGLAAIAAGPFVLRVAWGQKTCAERLGHHELVPWRIGPAPEAARYLPGDTRIDCATLPSSAP